MIKTDCSTAAIPTIQGVMVCMHQTHDFMPYMAPNPHYVTDIFLPAVAAAGLNTILIEYEAMYPWADEHTRLSCRDAWSRVELADILTAAKHYGIEVIPLVQTLGHIYHILLHPAYTALAEVPGMNQQLCPSNPATLKLAGELLSDVMESHPDSRYLHLGGDECRLLGSCPVCQAKGAAASYAEFYRKLTAFVLAHDRIPILWHDIAVKRPELLDTFDKRVMFHFWSYGDHCHGRLEEQYKVLSEHVGPERIIGGPAVRCDEAHGALLPSAPLIRDNIRRMDALVRREGMSGSILTDWPDSGMPFPLALPFLGYHGAMLDPAREVPCFDPSEDIFYGLAPFSTGFQTQLVSYLDRFKFAPYDMVKALNNFPGVGARNVYFELFHRKLALRERLEAPFADPYRHLQYRTLDVFLALALAHLIPKQDHVPDPGMAAQFLAEYRRAEPELRAAYHVLYDPISYPGQVSRYLDMLFKPCFMKVK